MNKSIYEIDEHILAAATVQPESPPVFNLKF